MSQQIAVKVVLLINVLFYCHLNMFIYILFLPCFVICHYLSIFAILYMYSLFCIDLSGSEPNLCLSSDAQKSCAACIATAPQCSWCASEVRTVDQLVINCFMLGAYFATTEKQNYQKQLCI